MNRVCFGQNFEDVVLWRALGDVQAGRYLDIGAQHPIIDSVSQSFYRAGWRGVHVEPTPQYADALRKDRPDETVIEAAAGDQAGLITIFVFPDTGLSTSAKQVAKGHQATGLLSNEIIVPVVSLDALLDRFVGHDLHWLKIDVEGNEASVLRSWCSSSVRPWIILIEAIDPITRQPNDSDWRDLLEAHNYDEALFDGVNRYFVAAERAELVENLKAPANCLDGFYVPRHHWSAAHAVDHCQIEILAANRRFEQSEADQQRIKAELDLAAADRDQLGIDRGFLEQRLVDLQSERSALSDAVGRLGQELNGRAVELGRSAERQGELIRFSQELSTQLNAAQTARRDAETALAHSHCELEDAVSRVSLLRAEIFELHQLADARAARLSSADDIVALSSRQVRPWFKRLAALASREERKHLRKLHHAVVKWNSGLTPSIQDGLVPPTNEAIDMDIFNFDNRDPYHRAASLADLCRFSDVKFIRCAFVTILGRQSEPEGEVYYLNRLRSGVSKLSILGDLRFSAEGKAHDPGIAGLDRALRKHRNATKPIIGWVVRLMTGREGDSSVERRLRALCNQIDIEHERSARRAATANHLILSLDHKIHSVEKQLRSALAGQATSVRHISQADPAGEAEWVNTLSAVLNG